MAVTTAAWHMLATVAGAGAQGASTGMAEEFATYFLRRPPIPTLVRSARWADRARYHSRILQRLGSSVDRFAVLNIHRIGIEAPPLLVWEEVLRWGPDSNCWPGRIAPVLRRPEDQDVFQIYLLGRTHRQGLPRRDVAGLPLIKMRLERRQDCPGTMDVDNARFVLYRCVGGYPIGLFSIYVRSAIVAEGERERTQLFFVVAFDFYGRPHWSRSGPVRWVWERIHNRVTGNVLHRFKEECETEFARIQAGS